MKLLDWNKGCELDIPCDHLPHPYPLGKQGLQSKIHCYLCASNLRPLKIMPSSSKKAASLRLENGQLEKCLVIYSQVGMLASVTAASGAQQALRTLKS